MTLPEDVGAARVLSTARATLVTGAALTFTVGGLSTLVLTTGKDTAAGATPVVLAAAVACTLLLVAAGLYLLLRPTPSEMALARHEKTLRALAVGGAGLAAVAAAVAVIVRPGSALGVLIAAALAAQPVAAAWLLAGFTRRRRSPEPMGPSVLGR